MQPVLVKLRGNVLHRVQPHALEVGLLVEPFPPVVQLAADVFVARLDVAEHEEVVVAFFVVDHLIPVIGMVVDDAVDPISLLALGVIHAGEAGEVPLEGGILISPTGKGELGVGADLVWLGKGVLAIILVHLDDVE